MTAHDRRVQPPVQNVTLISLILRKESLERTHRDAPKFQPDANHPSARVDADVNIDHGRAVTWEQAARLPLQKRGRCDAITVDSQATVPSRCRFPVVAAVSAAVLNGCVVSLRRLRRGRRRSVAAQSSEPLVGIFRHDFHVAHPIRSIQNFSFQLSDFSFLTASPDASVSNE
jgi:hypothetical protein